MPIEQQQLSPEFQKLNQGSAWVELFAVDLTPIGGPLYHFCNELSKSGGLVTYRGIPYMALPMRVEGWGSNLTGTSAKPTLTISNLEKTLQAAVIGIGDMVGARITRIRTFAKFLDDGETPNPDAYLGPDVVFIEQKVTHNKQIIQFQLCSILDRMGMRLPRRQILKDESYLGCAFPGVGRTRTG